MHRNGGSSLEPSNTSHNNSVMVSTKRHGANDKQAIKVCIRVRPSLPHERAQEQVVYFPPDENDPQGLQSIKVADG